MGILRLLIQLHGCFPLGVHWLTCVYCHPGAAGSTGSSDIVGQVNSPLLLAMPMQPLGVAPSQFP